MDMGIGMVIGAAISIVLLAAFMVCWIVAWSLSEHYNRFWEITERIREYLVSHYVRGKVI